MFERIFCEWCLKVHLIGHTAQVKLRERTYRNVFMDSVIE